MLYKFQTGSNQLYPFQGDPLPMLPLRFDSLPIDDAVVICSQNMQGMCSGAPSVGLRVSWLTKACRRLVLLLLRLLVRLRLETLRLLRLRLAPLLALPLLRLVGQRLVALLRLVAALLMAALLVGRRLQLLLVLVARLCRAARRRRPHRRWPHCTIITLVLQQLSTALHGSDMALTAAGMRNTHLAGQRKASCCRAVGAEDYSARHSPMSNWIQCSLQIEHRTMSVIERSNRRSHMPLDSF